MAKLVAQILLMFFLESSLSVAEQSCGGVLTNISGVITSPNYPNNYPDSITCTWKIAPEKSHVNLTIEDLMLEDSQTCQEFDFVKIRAKVGYSFSEVALCGTMASRQISLKVEGTAIEITFKSDDMFNERGFKISYRAYDVDPCLEKNGGCSHMCNLEKGTRVCSCSNGYKLMYDKRTCKGENSCYFAGRKKCPSGTRTTCKDRPNGTTTCECWYGYKRERDAGPCQDIDECREKPGRCGLGTCRNGRGWFTCNCPKGYYYNGNTCVDANECGYKDCGDAKCVNTHGSYICQCRPGYQFNDDLLACEDINECDTTSSACDHVCNNTEGSYNCSCRPGYFLDSDGSTCRAARVEGLGQVRRSETCQGTSLVISCKNDQKALIIHKATYGRGDLTLCPYRQEQGLPEEDTDDSSLCEEDMTDKIKGLCGWRKICNITVSSETLGAVCPGVYKHLSVRYSCGKPLMCQSLPPSHSCAAVETNDCTSDESCQSSQMCCFDGCKRTCSVPSLYTADI